MFLNEHIQSSLLKTWFAKHGGVKQYFDGQYSNNRVNQDGLGEVTDDMIIFTKECNNRDVAYDERFKLAKGRDGGVYYVVYTANDGCCLVVGLNSKFKTDITHGGPTSLKRSERYWKSYSQK